MEKSIIYRMIADFLLNMSAGWMGALVLVPQSSKKRLKTKRLLSILNIVASIVFLLLSYKFYTFLL